MLVNNIKALKEFIEDMPDDMPVHSCCSCGGGTCAIVAQEEKFDEDYNSIGESDFLWIGYA